MKLKRILWASVTTLAVAVGALSAATARAGDYPERPIRVIVPFTPGAAADLVVRTVQPLLEKRLGVPLVMDYKSGAGGAIAVQEVARSAPDGYSLLLVATNNLVIDQFMQTNPKLDPMTALVPIVKIVEAPAVLFASTSMGVSTWADFKVKALVKGAHINFSSPGVGTTPHLSSLLLGKAIGTEFTHIPYRGGQAAIQALITNDVQFYMGNYRPLAQFVDQGRVRALAVASSQRLPNLPNVPTTKEAGVPDVITNNWFALVAPNGTPDSVVNRIRSEVQAALGSADVHRKFLDNGFLPSGLSGKAFVDELRNESRKWQGLIAAEKLAGKK